MLSITKHLYLETDNTGSVFIVKYNGEKIGAPAFNDDDIGVNRAASYAHRLESSAPDLLDALKRIANCMGPDGWDAPEDVYGIAIEAIAKAEGRTQIE